jgi:putative ABC transport system substrate-binding protein
MPPQSPGADIGSQPLNESPAQRGAWDAFKDGLTELGYSEGKGVMFVSRFAEGNYDRLPAFAADLLADTVTKVEIE